jgi:hypothetical protein
MGSEFAYWWGCYSPQVNRVENVVPVSLSADIQAFGNLVTGVWTPNEAEIEHARGKRVLRLSPNPITLIDSRPLSAHPRLEEGADSPPQHPPTNTSRTPAQTSFITQYNQISKQRIISPKENNACVFRWSSSGGSTGDTECKFVTFPHYKNW